VLGKREEPYFKKLLEDVTKFIEEAKPSDTKPMVEDKAAPKAPVVSNRPPLVIPAAPKK
jgi:hypothetical protein